MARVTASVIGIDDSGEFVGRKVTLTPVPEELAIDRALQFEEDCHEQVQKWEIATVLVSVTHDDGSVELV